MVPARRAVLAVGVALAVVLSGVAPALAAVTDDATAPATAASTAESTAPATATPAAESTAPAPVDACTTISESGRYVLGTDVLHGNPPISSACVRITASDVVLDGRSGLVDGNGVSDTTGVLVEGVANVTVRNLRVENWNRGVAVRNASDVTVRGVNATGNAVGIEGQNASVRVVDVTVDSNLRGVVLADPGDDVLRGTRVKGNHVVAVHAPLPVVDAFGVHLAFGPPLDPDGDGRYEDVTGDGDVGILDVAALPAVVAAHYLGITATTVDQRRGLDFDGDGSLGFGDVLSYVGLSL